MGNALGCTLSIEFGDPLSLATDADNCRRTQQALVRPKLEEDPLHWFLTWPFDIASDYWSAKVRSGNKSQLGKAWQAWRKR